MDKKKSQCQKTWTGLCVAEERACKLSPIFLLSRSWVDSWRWWLFSLPPICPHVSLSLMFYQDFPKCIRVSNPHPRVSEGALKVLELVEKVGFAPGSGRNSFSSLQAQQGQLLFRIQGDGQDDKYTGNKPISSLWAAGGLPGLPVYLLPQPLKWKVGPVFVSETSVCS